MASYRDSYDRPPFSRRHDSFTRPPDHDAYHAKPTAGYASQSHVRGGEVDAASRSDRKSQRRSYDPRDYYPPAPPPDTARPRRSWRHSWPPQPSCEDERSSLAKEAGSLSLLKGVGRDEAASRGAIDQDPIIQEVPEYADQGQRRHVALSDPERDTKSTGYPTPPTSEDERARKLRRRPSRLRTDLDNGVPEMSKRTSSPYSYSKPTPLKKDISSDRFLSPEVMTPPSSDRQRRSTRYSMSSAKPSSPRRESVRLSPGARPGQDYFSSEYGLHDNALVDDGREGNYRLHSGRRPTFSRQDTDHHSPDQRTSVVDFASAPNAQPVRSHLDARRKTETPNTLPALPRLQVEKTRRPSPLISSNASSDLDDYAISSTPGTPGSIDLRPQSRDASYASMRGVSPAASAVSAVSAVSGVSSASRREHSPPRSPRYSSEYPQERSSNSPQGGSVSSSRPSSPSPRTPIDSPRLPRTEYDWSSLVAANAARRSKPSSRLHQSMRQESMPDVRPSAPPRVSTSSSLPYPTEYGSGIPSLQIPVEREYQYVPVSGLSAQFESKTMSRATSPAPANSSRNFTTGRSARPPLVTRHSVATAPAEERYKPVEDKSKPFASSAQTKKELAILLKKGLPKCPRPHPTAGYDDWYTVIGAPQLVFCPHCVDDVFERTVYRPSLRIMPQLSLSSKFQCAFGASNWTRLAWVLTLQQQRTDLVLLGDIAHIEETSEPCPGDDEAVRTWYGLRDAKGLYVRDFHLCYADVRKIERVLPTLNGFFVPLPSRASYGKYKCALRVNTNRFNTYLDALMSTHDRAMATHKIADQMPFIDLVERKTHLPECKRDTVLIGSLWHFSPKIPEFTICPDCFDAMVEPEIKKNSDLAIRFYRAAQPVYDGARGSSCQLYSPYMRKVFRRAIEDNDLKYLARKARERYDAEARLQARYQDVARRVKRLGRESSFSTEEDMRKLNTELQRISNEWKTNWE